MSMVMCLYCLVGFMFGGGAFGLGYLMITLFMTCLWIIFDTQMIIEQAERGVRDVPGHALTLFMDLFNLFMKILRLLQQLEGNKNRKKK